VNLRDRWWLPWALGAVGTVAAIAAIVIAVDVPAALGQIRQLDPVWLLPGLVVMVVQLLLRTARWSVLLSTTAGRRIGVPRILGPLLVGYLGNNLLPARAGEAVRAVLVAKREDIGLGEVAATVITERAIDLLTLLALGAVAIWLATGAVGSVGIVLAAVGLVGFVVVRVVAQQAETRGWWDRLPSNRVIGLVRGLLGTLGRLPLGVLLACAGFSLAAWACDALLVLAAAKALGTDLTVLAAIAIGAGGVLGTAAPAAPGYVGTYELAAIAGGAAVGIASTVVLPIAIVLHLVSLIPYSIAGAVAMARLGGRDSLRTTPSVGHGVTSPG
jgi:uncharacterized membrane protein YbhN (UPF0104 family)